MTRVVSRYCTDWAEGISLHGAVLGCSLVALGQLSSSACMYLVLAQGHVGFSGKFIIDDRIVQWD